MSKLAAWTNISSKTTFLRHSLKLAIYCGRLADSNPQLKHFSLLSVFILFSIYKDNLTSLQAMHAVLKRWHMHTHKQTIDKHLTMFIAAGWVTRSGTRSEFRRWYRYSITAEGVQFLKDIDRACRSLVIPKYKDIVNTRRLSLAYYHRNKDKINEKRRKKPPTG
jgi:hypothetical protein